RHRHAWRLPPRWEPTFCYPVHSIVLPGSASTVRIDVEQAGPLRFRTNPDRVGTGALPRTLPAPTSLEGPPHVHQHDTTCLPYLAGRAATRGSGRDVDSRL